ASLWFETRRFATLLTMRLAMCHTATIQNQPSWKISRLSSASRRADGNCTIWLVHVLPRFEPARGRFWPPDGRGGRAGGVAGQLQGVEARDQLLEQDAHLQPGEMPAETGMGACAERDVARRVTIDPKALWFVKHGLIVVGRKIGQHQPIALANRPT